MIPSPYDTYTSPLATRNASERMLRLWSPRHKFNTWRRIWLAVAEAQHEVTSGWGGISEAASSGSPSTNRTPLVSKEQVEELRRVVERGITDDEIRAAEKYERELRHDVMAHVHALGDSCPKAKGIIHLGMTSQDVNDNADIAVMEQAYRLLMTKMRRVAISFCDTALRWKATPTLAFTHFQAAQPTTVGRRFAQWGYDVEYTRRRGGWEWALKYRGLRGATGTQASYLALLGDSSLVDVLEAVFLNRVARTIDSVSLLHEPLTLRSKAEVVHQLEHRIAREEEDGNAAEVQFLQRTLDDVRDGPEGIFQITEIEDRRASSTFELVTQTYPRVHDAQILSDLASCASVLHKIATDIRLLSNRKELDEPFESKQIGSSAMPYKRNPMRCERICGLTRFVMNLVGNAYDTAATQWLERTLDDSSNRRLSLPEAFLALDGALDLMHNVASGLIVHEAMVRKNLMAELPFMATENILMACVKLGGDRQHYHELIRVHAQDAGMRVKQEGLDNDLLDRLKNDRNFWSKARGGPLTAELDWDNLMDPMKYVGRSVEQTERFIRDVIEPLREQYKDEISKLDESGPRV